MRTVSCWMKLLIVAVATALAGFLSGCAPDVAPSSASIVTIGDTAPKVVTLTFDCGSDAGNTAAILDLLGTRGLTAAFGVTGQFADRYPALVQRMVREGHLVINHSYSHPYFTQLTSAQRASQLQQAEAALNRDGASSNGWFRPPYGDTNASVQADVAKAGYYLEMMWTIDSKGWVTNPRSTVQTVLNAIFTSGQLRNGAIILMHVGALSVDYQALPSVLWGLSARGYRIASLAQALTHGGIGAHYAALGAQHSVIGVPQTLEIPIPGGVWQLFSKGRMYWSRQTGAREVHGGILAKYYSLGSTSSALGFPTSDEFSVAGGRRSTFQHGYLTWNAVTKVVTVTYF